jgi:hypothetical protein
MWTGLEINFLYATAPFDKKNASSTTFVSALNQCAEGGCFHVKSFLEYFAEQSKAMSVPLLARIPDSQNV